MANRVKGIKRDVGRPGVKKDSEGEQNEGNEQKCSPAGRKSRRRRRTKRREWVEVFARRAKKQAKAANKMKEMGRDVHPQGVNEDGGGEQNEENG